MVYRDAVDIDRQANGDGGFGELFRALASFQGFPGRWWVAGGWAIDLFVGRRTRDHRDVDVMIPRSDQGAIHEHFRNCVRHKIVPHPDGLGGRGTLEPWRGERLDLPVHQVLVEAGVGRIEILLGEVHGRRWRFRRNPDVTLCLSDATRRSPAGVPHLAPEVVLLFKAKPLRSWDEADLAVAIPRLGEHGRRWLAGALAASHPGHRWIDRLRAGDAPSPPC
ncbi:MAG: nucleotidyltransferase domain-containing protein [Planctomycetota bacterium]